MPHAHAHAHEKCLHQAMEKAETLCADKGLRLTDARRKVLERVWESHKPVKAYDILETLSDKTHEAKPPTVYRALDFLRANGLVHKLNTLDAYIGCSHPLQAAHACHFLICDTCGEVSECCDDALNAQLAKSAAKQRFRLAGSTVEMHGICGSCAKS